VETIGPLISALAALFFLIFSVVAFMARRSERRASNLAAIRETNIAALRWSYEVRTKAAIHGWELPPLPREMTPEYLTGRAEEGANPELAKLADLAALAGGALPRPGETP
jgi:hypothetical protein